MAVLVSVSGGGGKPYTGDNPLTIGQAGFTFPAKTLLKDGLQIINGVNKEGQFVWKQLTAEGGDFVAFVTADDENSYPNGGEQDGYWYELVVEGVSGIDYGEITLTGEKANFYIAHNLGVNPKMAILVKAPSTSDTMNTSRTAYIVQSESLLWKGQTIYGISSKYGPGGSIDKAQDENNGATWNHKYISFYSTTYKFGAWKYYWIALA